MRDPAKPIGRITSSAYGVSRAAGSIHYCLHFEGPQSVFVCEQGRVYAIPSGTSRQTEWICKHCSWLVGAYVLNAYRNSVPARDLRAQIAGHLRDRARELGMRAA